MPGSALASREGNESRVEHILTERALKAQGKNLDEVNAALFGPRLERMLAAYPVTVRKETMGGVKVTMYEPKAGVRAANRHKVLINLHGGGFVGCFTECGGLESVPIAALTGIQVISVDYRLAPAARISGSVRGCGGGLSRSSQAHVAAKRGHLRMFRRRQPDGAVTGLFPAAEAAAAGRGRHVLRRRRCVRRRFSDPRRHARRWRAAAAAPGVATPCRRPAISAACCATIQWPIRRSDPKVLAQFPPTLVIAGTRDFALSAAVVLHSQLVANGVDARLHVWEGAAARVLL